MLKTLMYSHIEDLQDGNSWQTRHIPHRIVSKEVYYLRSQICLGELQKELHELNYSKIPKFGADTGSCELLQTRMTWLQQCINNIQTQLKQGMTELDEGRKLRDLSNLSIYIPTAGGKETYFSKLIISPISTSPTMCVVDPSNSNQLQGVKYEEDLHIPNKLTTTDIDQNKNICAASNSKSDVDDSRECFLERHISKENDICLETTVELSIQEKAKTSTSKVFISKSSQETETKTISTPIDNYPDNTDGSVNASSVLKTLQKDASPVLNRHLLTAVTTQLTTDYPHLLSSPDYLQKLATQQTQLLQSCIDQDCNSKCVSATTTKQPSSLQIQDSNNTLPLNILQSANSKEQHSGSQTVIHNPSLSTTQPCPFALSGDYIQSNSQNSPMFLASGTTDTQTRASSGLNPHQVILQSQTHPQAELQRFRMPYMYNSNILNPVSCSGMQIPCQPTSILQPKMSFPGIRSGNPKQLHLQSTSTPIETISNNQTLSKPTSFVTKDNQKRVDSPVAKCLSPPLPIKSYMINKQKARQFKQQNSFNTSDTSKDEHFSSVLDTSRLSFSNGSGKTTLSEDLCRVSSNFPSSKSGFFTASPIKNAMRQVQCSKSVKNPSSLAPFVHQSTVPTKVQPAREITDVQSSKSTGVSQVSSVFTNRENIHISKDGKRNKTPDAHRICEKYNSPLFQSIHDDWDLELDPFPETFKFFVDPKRPLDFGTDICKMSAIDYKSASLQTQSNKASASFLTKKATTNTGKQSSQNLFSEDSKVDNAFLGSTKTSNNQNQLKTTRNNSTREQVEPEIKTVCEVEVESVNEWHTVSVNKKPQKNKPKTTVVTKVTENSKKKIAGLNANTERPASNLKSLMSIIIPNVSRKDINGKRILAGTKEAKISFPSTSDEGEICVICCDELIVEKTKHLDCGHEFHVMCINEWVYQQERTCPICRQIALFSEDFPQLR